MFKVPDRIGSLIKILEDGGTVTQRTVDRIAALQALDLARLGEEFAAEVISQNESRLKELEGEP